MPLRLPTLTRMASRHPQVLKCEKDLLDECELRQEADKMLENKLTNHLHSLERNIRDSCQRLMAMMEPFGPKIKNIENELKREGEARRRAIEEVREDLREAIAMTAGVAARKAHQPASDAQKNTAPLTLLEEVQQLKTDTAEQQAKYDHELATMHAKVLSLETELAEERQSRSKERRELEDVIRAVTQPSLDTAHRLRNTMEEQLNERLDGAVRNLELRLDSERVAAEANVAAARSAFQTELDKRARLEKDSGAALTAQLMAEIEALKAASAEERRRREKAEEEIINNLGEAIISMRVQP